MGSYVATYATIYAAAIGATLIAYFILIGPAAPYPDGTIR